jgi:alpha-L-fucosidase
VHWGVASGRALPQSHSHARHSALNPSGSVPAETYDQYYKEFNPTAYDPDAWLKLAHDAGMRFDGIEPVGPERWKDTPARVAAMLHELQPGIMLSNHGGGPEDFVSFEMMVGPFDRVQPWEMTEPINPSGWVFNQPMPTRPFRELLRHLVYTVSRDGNYLLDVGPMELRPDGLVRITLKKAYADGTILP